MFALTPQDLRGRILDCGAGPASLNAEATAAGHRISLCDPLYRFSAADIRRRVEETSETLLAAAREHGERFVWRDIETPEKLGELRLAAMERFLQDLPAGLKEGRYRDGALPGLHSETATSTSHLLFLYSDTLSLEFHVASIREMCRVAAEARVFPLLSAYGEPSPHLVPTIRRLRELGYGAERRRVPYEFLRGANEMLTVTST